MKEENCLPSLKFFSNALDILVKQNDSTHAVVLWDVMVGIGLMPNLIMYNAVIGLLCNNHDVNNASRFFDEMVFHGTFPDSLTYNMIFECLIKNKKLLEVEKFSHEVIKNEWSPNHLNCATAITMLLDSDEPEMAVEMWTYKGENDVLLLEVSANALVVGLHKLCRLSDVRRFVEGILDRRILAYEVTMQRLKNAFCEESRCMRDKYDSLERRWKPSQI